MIERTSLALTRWCTRWIPDSFVIAGVLTVLVAAAATLVAPRPLDVVMHWGAGFWDLIPFTLQMAMVILSGYLVADAPPVRRALTRLAGLPSTPRGAIALTAVVSMSLAWINWGLSIIGSALLATRIGRRRLGVDFRLLVASAYLGLGCMWHAGLSASAPLTSSDPAQKFVKEYLKGPVPVTSTLFSPMNLGLAAVVLVVMTAFAALLHPRRDVVEPPADLFDDEPADADADAEPPRTPAERLERSPIVNAVFAVAALVFMARFLRETGAHKITINHVNLTFLGLAALLHRTPASLLASAERGGRYVWGVLLQFGFYAGIAGMLDKSGLATRLADAFVRVATPESFPFVVVWYSGVLNYVVPSGGAKWIIEVQYLAEASARLGVDLSRTIVAYAWGDMFTDIIQPFWAIPLLAVARLGFRDIMGFCLLFFLAYATIVSAAFLAWGYLG